MTLDRDTNILEALEHAGRPAFTVEGGVIAGVNDLAAELGAEAGTAVQALIFHGQEDYAALTDGCLSILMSIRDTLVAASVTRLPDSDLFLLLDGEDDPVLQGLALAARDLRATHTEIMQAIAYFSDLAANSCDAQQQHYAALLKRNGYAMLRHIANMSDAAAYNRCGSGNQSLQEMGALFGEFFEKAQTLLEHCGRSLEFTNLAAPVLSLGNAQKLERATYNLICNAVKFTPKGGKIAVSLAKRGSFLYLTVTDGGIGIESRVLGQAHCRYTRLPTLEDPRHGLGLGLNLVRSTALSHGGTLLIANRPAGTPGAQATMSLRIRPAGDTLRSPVMTVDYAGELDHGLLELSPVMADCDVPLQGM